MYESRSGLATAFEYGEATNDYNDVTVSSTSYYATLDFTVDAYSGRSIPGGEGNDYDSPAYISVDVGATASLNASSGYYGDSHAYADVDFGGWSIVDVTW